MGTLEASQGDSDDEPAIEVEKANDASSDAGGDTGVDISGEKVVEEEDFDGVEEQSAQDNGDENDADDGDADDGDADSDAESTGSDDEYAQEPFETHQHKVIQLCRDIGYGEPSKVERMIEGGFNRVIGLAFEARETRDCILRTPRPVLREHQVNEIGDLVSVLRYLAGFDFLYVPSVLAYDSTTNNVLECQYVLQERIVGQPIQDVFYELPLSEKLRLTTVVAELVTKMSAISFEKPGRLIGKRNIPNVWNNSSSAESEIVITGYRANPISDLPPVMKQPLSSLFMELLEFRKQKATHPKYKLMWENLQIVAEQ